MATGFCNETVYGKMNLLEVTGLVRMGPAEADAGSADASKVDADDDAEGSDADGSEAGVAAPQDVPFDAWPPASVLNDKWHAECAVRRNQHVREYPPTVLAGSTSTLAVAPVTRRYLSADAAVDLSRGLVSALHGTMVQHPYRD